MRHMLLSPIGCCYFVLLLGGRLSNRVGAFTAPFLPAKRWSSSSSPRTDHFGSRGTSRTTRQQLRQSTNNDSDSSNNNNKQVDKEAPKIELTDETIGQMIEATFIQACLQLATGYVDMAKHMVAALTAAYDRNLPLQRNLLPLVDAATRQHNTANRELTPDEIQLRTTWITIVYLTLLTLDRLEDDKAENDNDGEEEKSLDDKTRAVDIPPEAFRQYGPMVEGLVKKHLGLLATLTTTGDDNSDNASTTDTENPTAAALHAYNVKLCQLTLQTVQETRWANQKIVDENAVGPPQPNQMTMPPPASGGGSSENYAP